jgi:hypothetical protein
LIFLRKQGCELNFLKLRVGAVQVRVAGSYQAPRVASAGMGPPGGRLWVARPVASVAGHQPCGHPKIAPPGWWGCAGRTDPRAGSAGRRGHAGPGRHRGGCRPVRRVSDIGEPDRAGSHGQHLRQRDGCRGGGVRVARRLGYPVGPTTAHRLAWPRLYARAQGEALCRFGKGDRRGGISRPCPHGRSKIMARVRGWCVKGPVMSRLTHRVASVTSPLALDLAGEGGGWGLLVGCGLRPCRWHRHPEAAAPITTGS